MTTVTFSLSTLLQLAQFLETKVKTEESLTDTEIGVLNDISTYTEQLKNRDVNNPGIGTEFLMRRWRLSKNQIVAIRANHKETEATLSKEALIEILDKNLLTSTNPEVMIRIAAATRDIESALHSKMGFVLITPVDLTKLRLAVADVINEATTVGHVRAKGYDDTKAERCLAQSKENIEKLLDELDPSK